MQISETKLLLTHISKLKPKIFIVMLLKSLLSVLLTPLII